MVTLMDGLVVFGMLLLRIGVPLGAILLLAYLLKRLDRRWEVQARLERGEAEQAQTADERARIPKPARRPGADVPGIQMPFDPDLLRHPLPAMAAAGGKPCWETHGCTEAMRSTCAAPLHPDLPCWQARLEAEGHIPEKCVGCDIFQPYPPN